MQYKINIYISKLHRTIQDILTLAHALFQTMNLKKKKKLINLTACLRKQWAKGDYIYTIILYILDQYCL